MVRYVEGYLLSLRMGCRCGWDGWPSLYSVLLQMQFPITPGHADPEATRPEFIGNYIWGYLLVIIASN